MFSTFSPSHPTRSIVARRSKRIKIGPGCSVFPKTRNDRTHWYLWINTPQGERQIGLKTDKKTVAVERGRDLFRRYELGTFDPHQERTDALTFDEALNLYAKKKTALRGVSMKDITNFVRRFSKETGIQYVEDVLPRHVERFVHAPKKKRKNGTGGGPKSQATLAGYHRRISVFFSWCVEEGIIDASPCEALEKPADYEPLPRGMTEAEVDAICLACGHHWEHNVHVKNRPAYLHWERHAIRLMAATGLRPAEARRLTWGDVIWPDECTDSPGMLHVRGKRSSATGRLERTKTGDERFVTMLPEAERMLRLLQEETRLSNDPAETVLKAGDGRSPIATGYLSEKFRMYRQLAKLDENYDLYSLRHTFATEYLRRGGDVRMLMQEMGHKRIETTLRYVHVTPVERARLSRRLFEV